MLATEGKFAPISDRSRQIRGFQTLIARALLIVMLGSLLGACAGGLPDPVLLQGGSLTAGLTGSGTGNLQTNSTQTLPRSDASRVLSALAVERVLGQSTGQFNLLSQQ